MDNTVSENNNSQHRSTERVVLILEFLTETENSGKTLTEIANYLNAPKSSILPILRTLVSYGYLHYNPIVMQYFLGYKLYEIGTKYVGDSNMDDVIFQVMYNFASANDVTLIMGELIAGDVLVVQRVDPFEKLRLYRAVGRRIPAYADAAGKILLAEKSDADVMRLYPEGLTAITPKIRKKTISNPPPKKKLSIMPHASLSGGTAPVYVVLWYAPPGGNATNLRLRREKFPESGRKPQVAWYFYPV